MILVDSSVWIDHLRSANGALTDLLHNGQVLTHPFVIGELALGSLHQRVDILGALQDLPKATVADDDEVTAFINRHHLFGRDVGYIDAHLLASALLTAGAWLWTRDKRLHTIATALAIAVAPDETSDER